MTIKGLLYFILFYKEDDILFPSRINGLKETHDVRPLEW
jgi:hypothetical protein